MTNVPIIDRELVTLKTKDKVSPVAISKRKLTPAIAKSTVWMDSEKKSKTKRNYYRITTYDNMYGVKDTYSLNEARIFACKESMKGIGESRYVHITKNGGQFIMLVSWPKASYCQEVVLKNGRFAGYKYYKVSPVTGRVIKVDPKYEIKF